MAPTTAAWLCRLARSAAARPEYQPSLSVARTARLLVRLPPNISSTASSTARWRAARNGTRSVPPFRHSAAPLPAACSATASCRVVGGLGQPLPDADRVGDQERLAERPGPGPPVGVFFPPARSIALFACTSSEVNSSSTASRSAGKPITVTRPSSLDQTTRQRLACATVCSSVAFGAS